MFVNPTAKSTQVIIICKLFLYILNLDKRCVGDSLSLNALVCARTCMHSYTYMQPSLDNWCSCPGNLLALLHGLHSLKSDDCSPMHPFSKRQKDFN